MFALRHVNCQLRFLRLQLVPPFILTVLLVVSACQTIKASSVKDINSQDHKSQPLTSSDNIKEGRQVHGTPKIIQLQTGTGQQGEAEKPDQVYRNSASSDILNENHRRILEGKRSKRQNEAYPAQSNPDGLTTANLSKLRKFLSSHGVQHDQNRWITSYWTTIFRKQTRKKIQQVLKISMSLRFLNPRTYSSHHHCSVGTHSANSPEEPKHTINLLALCHHLIRQYKRQHKYGWSHLQSFRVVIFFPVIWVDASVLNRRRVFHRSPTSTVAKAVPCNHRVKYLDGQWEDNVLYAEEPRYVVVRREVDTSYPEPAEQHGW